MDYRDQMEAALARIAALESELSQRGSPTEQRVALDAEVKRLQTELAWAREAKEQSVDEVKRLKHALAEAQRALAVASQPAPTPELPSLAVHNRAQPPLQFADASGVLCPACLLVGERVEMMRAPPFRVGLWWREGGDWTNEPPRNAPFRISQVLCPRCCQLGLMRVAQEG
jgi:hypothetical protein